MVQIARRLSLEQQTDFSVRDDQPVLLQGMAAHWPAVRRWTPEYLMENFGDCSVALSHYATAPNQKSREKARVPLAQYLKVTTREAAETAEVNLGSYVAGWHFMKNAPRLAEDMEIPAPFRDNLLERVDREIINYDWISLFIGHSRVETPLHTDSFSVCVWLANLVGRKIIRVIPPVDYENIHNGLDAFDDRNVRRLSSLGIPVIEAVIEAGDVFIIPPGYWHQVRNDGFTVAVSTNFMSAFHFLTYEQQLKAKILAPYLKLLKLKREVLGSGELDHSSDSLRHFNYIRNEDQFLSFLEGQLKEERRVLAKATRLLAGNA